MPVLSYTFTAFQMPVSCLDQGIQFAVYITIPCPPHPTKPKQNKSDSPVYLFSAEGFSKAAYVYSRMLTTTVLGVTTSLDKGVLGHHDGQSIQIIRLTY